MNCARPITAVALQLENVRGDLPAGACAQSFSQLEAGVSRAQRLVDQLLKLSRQEAAAQEPPSAVDLQAQLHESINALIALADQRSIDLGLVRRGFAGRAAGAALRRRRPAQRAGQPDRERAALHARGRRRRRAPVERARASPRWKWSTPARASRRSSSPRVFDRFFRVPGTGARGSGLGLAIARSAAQRCGLRVSLRNRDDRSGLDRAHRSRVRSLQTNFQLRKC